MRLLYALVALATFSPLSAFAQYTYSLEGSGIDYLFDVTTDASGNTYIVGAFDGTIDLDPSDGPDAADTFTRRGSFDVFVASYSSTGAYRWGFRLGDSSTDYGISIATDGGQVYVAGQFQGTVDFDPSGVNRLLVAQGLSDGFIATYDAATGAFEWANRMTGSGFNYAQGVAVSAGTVAVVGGIEGTITFESATSSPQTTEVGGTDSYVVAYDAVTGGTSWFQRIGGNGGEFTRAVSASGDDILVTGSFENTADFETGSGATRTSQGSGDIFLASYDRIGGALDWVTSFGGGSSDLAYGLATDGVRAYVGGWFASNDFDFDPGPSVASAAAVGSVDAYVAAYALADGSYLWSNQLGTPSNERVQRLATDGLAVAVIGDYSQTLDLDAGPGSDTVTPVGGQDVFIAAYDPATGAYLNGGSVGGSQSDFGRAIAVSGGLIYAGGEFNASADLDPAAGSVDTRTTTGATDVYLIAQRSVALLPVELTALSAWAEGDAAHLVWETSSETDNAGFAVEHRAPGGDFAEAEFVAGVGTTSEPQRYAFQLDRLAPGTHLFRLRQVDFDGTASLSDEVEVSIGMEGTHRLSVWPNPTSGAGSVRLDVSRAQTATVEVYDALGRRVATLLDAGAEASTVVPLPDGLPAGLYLVRARGETFSETVRLRVVR